MPDSTNQFVIEKGEEPVISVQGRDGNGENPDIGIDLGNFHFSLMMPRKLFKELAEKIQDYLIGEETDSREQAEEEAPA